VGRKILDLFCGAGGFSLGFKETGNQLIGVDTWEIAGETWEHNIQGEFILKDVRELDLSTIGKVDILIGSPPCQPFSKANIRGKTEDPEMVLRYLEIRDELNPEFWVMEEVPGVVKTGLVKGRFFRACDFGLPHRRKRLFAGNYPEPVKKPYTGYVVPTPVCRDPLLTHDGKEYVLDRWDKFLDTPLASLRGIGQSKGYQTVKQDYKSFQEVAIKLGLLPEGEIEGFSPQVLAFVMGFPLEYEFAGKKWEKYKQIGNAVCPPIARAIYKAIKKGKTIGMWMDEFKRK